jgi:uncharacterized membrane protein
MKLDDYKLFFVTVGLIGVLLVCTPAIIGAIPPPGDEQFSELYLLGPNHMAENYPYNLVVGQKYSIYVGVGNQLGSSAQYVLYVKLGNLTDQLPNNNLGTPSPIQPLNEYRFSIKDNMKLENPLNFLVTSASIQGDNSQINTLQINNVAFNVNKPAIRNSTSTMFTYQLFFELWIYNVHTGSVEFNNRFVNLHLNLTPAT